MTVLKLTQVGGVRILRSSREPSLRNSAKLLRNFGIRSALGSDREHLELLRVAENWR